MRPRSHQENARLTSTFLLQRGRFYAEKPPVGSPEHMIPDRVFTPAVEQFLALLGLAPTTFRKLQANHPTGYRLKLYPNGISDEVWVAEVLREASINRLSTPKPWQAADCIDWDKVEACLQAAGQAGEIFNAVFSAVAGSTLPELESLSRKVCLPAPGRLPPDRQRMQRAGKAYSKCPHDQCWYRDELFGYRFEVITYDRVARYSYNNPPEEDFEVQCQGYHATLRQVIQDAFTHIEKDDLDRTVQVRFKDFTLLNGIHANGEYSWDKLVDSSTASRRLCPIGDHELQQTLFDIEHQLLGDVKSAERFLITDLGL